MTQIILISSIVLNSFLLIYLFGLLPFSLFISLLLNLGAMFYLRFLLVDRTKRHEEHNQILTEISDFTNHLEQIYELEMFYGDETLEQLITHSKRLINIFYQYENEYFSEVSEELSDEQREDNDGTS
tara:strand:- start:458 stop:838 length:381 start_codon:yes stop_codon:yes gene_type:complete